jgi:NADH-quinone oxidoreductase subunit A
MGFEYATVLVFAGIAISFLLIGVGVGNLVRPRIPDPEKETIYECGERPIGPAWFKFNPRFYVVALIFLVFDVEVTLLFPVATVFQDFVAAGAGLWAFFSLFVFLFILTIGLVYEWANGDLDWVRRSAEEKRAAAVPFRRTPPSAPADGPSREAA